MIDSVTEERVAGKVSKGTRIMALDVFRGFTIVLMIIVNNGAGPDSFTQLSHSDWNGLTLCDLVFPFFLFIMGVTTYLSMSKSKSVNISSTIIKIFRRTILILLVCWLIHWFDNICSGRGIWNFSRLRLTGVLTRIALCYCIVSLLSLHLSIKWMITTSAILLTLYGILLMLFNGYTNSVENINTIVDRWLIPEGHLYTKRPVDPEGILATFSTVGHTIIGYCCGYIIKKKSMLDSKLVKLFVIGTMLMIGGFCLCALMPVNKRIWSPSYVLLTCGMASTLLATLSWLIDGKGFRKEFIPFEAYGVNPLFLYVLGELIGIIFSTSGLKDNIYNSIAIYISAPQFVSLLYSLFIVLILTIFAIPLYYKRIYIKI